MKNHNNNQNRCGFYVGQRVESRLFGGGTVVEIDIRRINAVTIKFDSDTVNLYTIDGRMYEWDEQPCIVGLEEDI